MLYPDSEKNRNGANRTETRDFTIICGHYGCGKTNLSLNLALSKAKEGKKVTLVDLDLINPYFRSSDYEKLLAQHGITLIAPVFANTTLDTPVISSRIASVFEKEAGNVIIDLGGDDAGAAAIGCYSHEIAAIEYDMLCVINCYRVLSETAEETGELLREIEHMSRLKATGLVNNSHLKGETTPETILSSLPYAKKTAELLKLPVRFTSVPRDLYGALSGKIPNLYPVDIHVRSPWE